MSYAEQKSLCSTGSDDVLGRALLDLGSAKSLVLDERPKSPKLMLDLERTHVDIRFDSQCSFQGSGGRQLMSKLSRVEFITSLRSRVSIHFYRRRRRTR